MYGKAWFFACLPFFVIALLFTGCSSNPADMTAPGSSEPLDTPGVVDPGEACVDGTGSHFALGFYACTADPEAGTLDIEPLREANKHINAVWYLQAGEQYLTVESQPQFSNGGKQLDVDIGIRHPIADPIFTGFDVRAIFISEGDVDGWADPTMRVAGPNQTRLMNPDGYTRWWNPEEFTHGGIYGYLHGNLGHHILPGDAAILNGFKYFSDGLGKDDDLSALAAATRGVFSSNTKQFRHFTISLMGGLKFNYAVDASWAMPTKVPPIGLDDFPPHANQLEPYRIEVDEWVNTLWYDGSSCGGNIFYYITAYDWQGSSTIGGAFLEIPNLNIENALNNIIDIGPNHVTWEFRAYNPDISKAGPADVLVSVYSPEGDYQGPYTGVYKLLRAYTMGRTEVSSVQLFPVPPVAIAKAETSTEIKKHESVTFYGGDSYDPDGEDLTYLWDFDGDGNFGDAYDSGTDINPTYIFHPSGSFNVDLKVIDSEFLEDTLDEKITVNVSNQPPTAVAEMSGQEPYYAGAWYTFDATGSFDPDGEVVLSQWDFDYDGISFNVDEEGPIVLHAFEVGSFDVMLRVFDDDGASDDLDMAIPRTFIYKENSPPEITSVDFSRTTILTESFEERVTLHVYWGDPDVDDEHTVVWTADNGQGGGPGEFIEIDENTYEWVAPAETGHYVLTVRVYDLFMTYDEDSSIMIRVTQYPTGQTPYGYNVSKPAPSWSLISIPDEVTFNFDDISPGNVIFMHFLATS